MGARAGTANDAIAVNTIKVRFILVISARPLTGRLV
jgi:hypothetical protein